MRNNNDKYLETSRLDLPSKFIRKFNSIVREGKKNLFRDKKKGEEWRKEKEQHTFAYFETHDLRERKVS